MREITSTDIIKTGLINSCVNFDAKSFIPFLMSQNVQTGMPNKIRFYQFFKQMIDCSKEGSIGKLTPKMEMNNSKTKKYLNFYDETHKHPRLSIEIKETENTIYIDTLPF